jgi:hypothetical protein
VASCSNCDAGTYSSAGAASCTGCASGSSSLAGASSCTLACVSVAGNGTGDGINTHQTTGNASLTIDNDESTFLERKDSSSCNPSCGATSTIDVTYTLSVATQIESISVAGYRDHATELPVVITFGDGSTTTVQATTAVGDFSVVVPGPWANVASISMTLQASFGSQGGGGAWVQLKETRIKAAGLPRLPKCG